MSLFHPTSESSHPSETGKSLSEAFLNVSSVRDALPEQHRAHFDELRESILAFCHEFKIPVETLRSKEAFGVELASKRIPQTRMAHAVSLFARLEHLVTNKEPLKEEHPEYLEEAEHLYHLTEQYNAQVFLLQRCGILHTKQEQLPTGRLQRLFDLFQSLLAFGKKKRPEIKGTKETFYITGTNGQEYSVPTLEQIAQRLYEQREKLETKRDQGFTKLLLVPFGMNLDALLDTFKQFLLCHRFLLVPDSQRRQGAEELLNMMLYSLNEGGEPSNIYDPQCFEYKEHHGRTKTEILAEQEKKIASFPPGWRIVLLQSLNQEDLGSVKGIASIPRNGRGKQRGVFHPRPDVEAGYTPSEYLSIFVQAQQDSTDPYHGESGMTPEDWIIAFMTHLEETRKPLDESTPESDMTSACSLTGAYLSPYGGVTEAYWYNYGERVTLDSRRSHISQDQVGARFVVEI